MPSKWRIVRNKTPWKEGTLERRQWTESSEVLCSREQWDLVQDGGIWKIQNFYRTAFSWIFMELACSDIKVHFLTTVQCLQGISEHEVPESTWSLAQKQESLWKGENGWTWTEVVWFLGKLGFGTWSSVSSICSIFPIFLPVLRGKALEQILRSQLIWQAALSQVHINAHVENQGTQRIPFWNKIENRNVHAELAVDRTKKTPCG